MSLLLSKNKLRKVWEGELENIGQYSISVEDDVAKLYGDDV